VHAALSVAAASLRPADPWLAPGVASTGRWPGLVLHEIRPSADGAQLAWASRGTTLLCASIAESGGHVDWRIAATVPSRFLPPADRALALVRGSDLPALQPIGDHLANAARTGVHHLVTLPSGTRLVGVSGSLLRWSAEGAWSVALRYDGFRKPARFGVAVDDRGRAWVAQYALNPRRDLPITLYRSDDDGQTFVPARVFAPSEVRHLHFIQADPFDGSLWLGSGDTDRESAIWRSTDGQQWTRVGGGAQAWRAIGLAFLPDAVVWGTDAGRDAAHFANVAVRWDRSDGQVRAEQCVAAPVHGIGALSGGCVGLTTGCEGGANERDRAVHVWLRSQAGAWTEIARFRQGLQPRRAQYAVAHLAVGQDGVADLWLQLRGTSHMALGITRLTVEFAGDA